ncbi:MAG: nucleoside triphosphate pyrophosphatase [Pirellulaceae bacterium]
MELILASTSPYRRQLVERLGLEFCCAAPGLDEDAWKATVADPRQLAEQLAEAKARCVFERKPAAAVIGSDQLVAWQGRTLGKPGSRERAIDQLKCLAGTTHELVTAVCILTPQRRWAHTDVARLRMRALRRDEIERYVDADQPWDCAGAYKLESRGIVLFESIESVDQTAITGLPLMALTSILREIGFAIP